MKRYLFQMLVNGRTVAMFESDATPPRVGETVMVPEHRILAEYKQQYSALDRFTVIGVLHEFEVLDGVTNVHIDLEKVN